MFTVQMNIMSLFDLNGKTALVTGCKRGIGKSFAVALARAGADIIGVSATLDERESEVQREVEALGRKFSGYACDFRDRDALYRFIGKIQAKTAPVDILFNNAGNILRQPAAEHTDAFWDEIIEVNQTSAFILAREFGKQMIERGYGKIIFTASLLTFQGGILVPGYAASKGAIGQLTKALANEWAAKGVNVNAIAPGYIATDNTEALRSDNERSAAILARIPAGRWGKPEDLDGIAVFLSSAASDYINGAVIPVDGGWLGR